MTKKKSYPISEIFSSISGEGITSGLLAVFVRMGGCNLRCTYCDTLYAQEREDSNYKLMTINEIIEEVKKQQVKQVICTGGEPLWRENREVPLALASAGFDVHIETNGSMPLYSWAERERVQENLHYALDIKCPSSEMAEQDKLVENIDLLSAGDELKFVVGSKEDFLYAMDILKTHSGLLSQKNILLNFSAIFGELQYEELSNLLLDERKFFYSQGLTPRLSLQLHKIIWDPEIRGV